MKIVIFGAGYVGLVSGACFAHIGHHVTCIDPNKEKIDQLKKNIIPIYEEGLKDLVEKYQKQERLSFETDFTQIMNDNIDVIMIAVGTPARRGGGHADLTYVFDVVDQIKPYLHPSMVIVTKSTVPVKTNHALSQRLSDKNVHIVSNPEFLREGQAIQDFMNPDRIIIGASSEEAFHTMRLLYKPLTDHNIPLIEMSPESAELTKYASNAFLATKITFINEMANLAEKTGANIQDIAYGMGLDRRIGRDFLKAGPGYGGSCFPKDTLALEKMAHEYDVSSQLIQSVVSINAQRPLLMAHNIHILMGNNLKDKKLAFLGLTFKAHTDDMREAPSLKTIPQLHRFGAQIHAYDPQAKERDLKDIIPFVTLEKNIISCFHDADAIIIMTEWPEFKTLNFNEISTLMKQKIIIDLRNLLDRDKVIQDGFQYYGVGKGDFYSVSR